MSKSIVLSRLSAQRAAVLALLAVIFLYVGWFGLPGFLLSLNESRFLDDYEYRKQIELLIAVEQSVLLATYLAIVIRQIIFAANLPLVKPTERPIQFLVAFLMAAGLIWLLFLFLLREAFISFELLRLGAVSLGGAMTSFVPALAITVILLFSALLLLDVARTDTRGFEQRLGEAWREGPRVAAGVVGVALLVQLAQAGLAMLLPRSLEGPIFLVALAAFYFLGMFAIAEVLLRKVPELRLQISSIKSG